MEMKLPTKEEAVHDAFTMFTKSNQGWREDFSNYSDFYHIATEDIKTYMNAIESNIQVALSVASSADQGIALSKKGAKDVYLFDINRADFYFIYLKKAAISTLKRKDFLDFLIAENSGIIMDYRIYEIVRLNLPEPIRCFWDFLYRAFSYNAELMSKNLFRMAQKHAKMARTVNDYYKNNESYYATQSKVKQSNWHFIESDFYSLDKNLPKQVSYDAIILSNLYEYLNYGIDVSQENAKKYIHFIKNVLLPKLNQGGTIMAGYLYLYDSEVDQFIQKKLQEEPNGWAPSAPILTGLDSLIKYAQGWTGQNVSYHYLLEEIKKDFNIQEIPTESGGYGISSAKKDLAILIKK